MRGDPAAGPFGWREAAQYHGTRAASYALLGMVVGLVSAATLRPVIEAFGMRLGVALGVVMLAYALVELARAIGARRDSRAFVSLFQRRPHGESTSWSGGATLFRHAQRLRAPRAIGLGIATALLPCAFLYAALAQAALIAHPVWSGAAMLAFAVATSPALWAGSGLSAWLERRFPRAAPILFAILLVLTSISILWRALHGGEHDHSHHHS